MRNVTNVRTVIVTGKEPAARPVSSAVVQAGQPVFVSRQRGIDPETRRPPTYARGRTELAVGHICRALEEAELGLDRIVKTAVCDMDVADCATRNEVHAREFPQPFPARTTVHVARLLATVPTDIEAVAAVP